MVADVFVPEPTLSKVVEPPLLVYLKVVPGRLPIPVMDAAASSTHVTA
jgi:hypothetical protein